MNQTFDPDDDLRPEYDFSQLTVVARCEGRETSSQKEYDFSHRKRGEVISSQGKLALQYI